MSLTGVIGVTGFETGSAHTVTRTAAGTIDATGAYTPGATSTFTIAASVQPASGRELQVLPEAVHAREVRVVYTTTELRTVDQAAGTPADSVSIDGATWDVVRVEGPWIAFGGTHYVAYVAREP